MNRRHVASIGIALSFWVCNAHAQSITLTRFGVRSSGIFGFSPELGSHGANVSDVTLNGGAFPEDAARTTTDNVFDVRLTYGDVDLDGNGSANDSFTFTINVQKSGSDGGDLAILNQGFDTGFGDLNDVIISVNNVSGMTTDFGAPIVFDGFTGAELGAGNNGNLDRSAEINGTRISFFSEPTGSFEFFEDGIDFAPTPTVLFDNSGGVAGSGTIGFGSIVIRSYDLQFSVAPTFSEVTGDFNGDGDVDLMDLDSYNQRLSTTVTADNFLGPLDLNENGIVGGDDFFRHYTELVETSNGGKGTFAGDANLDGTVDVLGDAFPFVRNLGNTSATSWSEGDFDGDGEVTVLADAFILVSNLGNSNAGGN